MKFVGNSVPSYPSALNPSAGSDIVDKDYVDLWLPKSASVLTSFNVSTSATSAGPPINQNSTSGVYVGAHSSTPGPVVTTTTGTSVLVIVGATLSQNTSSCWACMSFTVSGATSPTLAASDDRAVAIKLGTVPASQTEGASMSNACLVTGLTAGSNTFTAQYSFLTGGTASFSRRTLTVFRLN